MLGFEVKKLNTFSHVEIMLICWISSFSFSTSNYLNLLIKYFNIFYVLIAFINKEFILIMLITKFMQSVFIIL